MVAVSVVVVPAAADACTANIQGRLSEIFPLSMLTVLPGLAFEKRILSIISVQQLLTH